ncbi:hypothetical protein [Pseudogemmobacter sonorensis]
MLVRAVCDLSLAVSDIQITLGQNEKEVTLGGAAGLILTDQLKIDL